MGAHCPCARSGAPDKEAPPLRTHQWALRVDEPTFTKSADSVDLYFLGRFTNMKMSDAELHQLRLAIDAIDDIVNGPMR